MYEDLHDPALFMMSTIVVGGMILLMWIFGGDDNDKQNPYGSAQGN